MAEQVKIKLEPVNLSELPHFITKMQEAFAVAVKEKFGTCEPIPSEQEVRSSFQSPGNAAYHLVWNDRRIGGAVIKINEAARHNSLELFFISPEYHNKGLGLAAWKAIEAKYPYTLVWETITPYFEERNIHFYINKCGFHIVEFFNKHHIDPNMPDLAVQSNEYIPGQDAYFRFEKVMRPSALNQDAGFGNLT